MPTLAEKNTAIRAPGKTSGAGPKKTKRRRGQLSEPSKEYLELLNLPDSTHDFFSTTVKLLNVKYKDAPSADDIVRGTVDELSVPQDVYLSNLSASEIQALKSNKHDFEKLEEGLKASMQLVNYVWESDAVLFGSEKSRTNAFVYNLLTTLGFGKYPLIIQPQALHNFNIRTRATFSRLGFAVASKGRVLLVDDDKHLELPYYNDNRWAESQFAAKMIAGAYTTYSGASEDYTNVVYGVIALGLRFTFYKAIITPEYLEALHAASPDPPVEILRYPQDSDIKRFPHLDFGKSKERKEIIDILLKMRECLHGND